MKMKNFVSAAAAGLLLILFLPVFCCVVFIGNAMDYNPDHKIEILCSNATLFLFTLSALLLITGLFFLLRKIPFNKYTITGTVLFSLFACILFYAVKVENSKCIAFYGGWDCGMVANSARWLFNGEDMGYGDYYLIYCNNIPILWLLYVLYGFSSSLSAYPYNPDFIWIQFQCLMFAAAVFLIVMTVLIISRKIAPALLSLLAGMLFLGLCPWQIIPYTDICTLVFPILVVFLYAVFRQVNNPRREANHAEACGARNLTGSASRQTMEHDLMSVEADSQLRRPGSLPAGIKSFGRYFIWLLMIFTGMIGGIMKATCYVALIAVVAVDFLRPVFGSTSPKNDEELIPPAGAKDSHGTASRPRRQSQRLRSLSAGVKDLGLRIILLLCGVLLAFWCRSGMYKTVHYVPDPDLQITWSNYFYNGLNELTTGACSGDGLSIVHSYAEYPGSFRRSVELHYAKDRIMEKGFGGLLNFWLRKQVMNFNDGTFSWFQEGFFNAWEYENMTDSSLKEPLRDFWWADGDDYVYFSTLSQGLWIFILFGIILEALSTVVISIRSKSDPEALCLHTVGITVFIGIFLFVMLFEGRARYLLNNTPVFIMLAILGYHACGEALLGCLRRLRGHLPKRSAPPAASF